jgi:hypothetical protein
VKLAVNGGTAREAVLGDETFAALKCVFQLNGRFNLLCNFLDLSRSSQAVGVGQKLEPPSCGPGKPEDRFRYGLKPMHDQSDQVAAHA